MRRVDRTTIVAIVCALAFASLLAMPALADSKCTALSGTIAGHFDFTGAQGPGWYGRAYLTFGDDRTVVAADLVDLNDGYKAQPSRHGNFAGDEILTYTIDGAGSFTVSAHFLCVGGSTPSYCGFTEEGKIVEGTGSFTGMTGNVSIRGSAVFFGAEPTRTDPWLWTAQMSGSVCTPQ